MSNDNKKKDIGQTIMVESAIRDIKPNPNLGVTKKFDRKNYQDSAAMERFKQNAFKKGPVKDPISGLELAPDKATASQLYGSDNINARTAETDHITPLKQVHDKLKDNPFISDEDVKNIANKDSNFGMKSRTSNASKGGKTNAQTIKANKKAAESGKAAPMPNEAKRKLRAEQRPSEAGTFSGEVGATAKNVASEAVHGAGDALEASAIPVAMNVLKNIVQCCRGEKTAKEAVKEVAVTVGSVAGWGSATRIIQTMFKNTPNPVLTELLRNNYAPRLIACAMYLKDDVVGLMNGTISKEQATANIVSKTAGLFAGELVKAGVSAALGGAFVTFGGADVIGTAAAKYVETCTQNLMDEVVGLGAWGMIKDAAADAQKTADFILDSVNRVERNTAIIDECIRGSLEDMKDIISNLEAFEKNK